MASIVQTRVLPHVIINTVIKLGIVLAVMIHSMEINAKNIVRPIVRLLANNLMVNVFMGVRLASGQITVKIIVVYHVNRRANKTVDHVGNVRLDMEASTV